MTRRLPPIIGVVLGACRLIVTRCTGLRQASRFHVLSAPPCAEATSPGVPAEPNRRRSQPRDRGGAENAGHTSGYSLEHLGTGVRR